MAPLSTQNLDAYQWQALTFETKNFLKGRDQNWNQTPVIFKRRRQSKRKQQNPNFNIDNILSGAFCFIIVIEDVR